MHGVYNSTGNISTKRKKGNKCIWEYVFNEYIRNVQHSTKMDHFYTCRNILTECTDDASHTVWLADVSIIIFVNIFPEYHIWGCFSNIMWNWVPVHHPSIPEIVISSIQLVYEWHICHTLLSFDEVWCDIGTLNTSVIVNMFVVSIVSIL